MKKAFLAILLICLALMLAGCGCKHAESKLINAKDATCTTDGYTGDTICAKCSEVIIKGEVISAKGHIASEPYGVQEASCTREGFTGVISCTLCGEKISDGEVIPMTAHVANTELSNVRQASCSREGYTGDTRCYNCNMLMVEGETIPMIEHTPNAERHYAREASCTREGYTGDLYCSACGDMLEEGEAIPMMEHTLGEPLNAVEVSCLADGYTGDRVCAACERTIEGEVMAKLAHSYDETNTCTACGYMVAGLYIDGQLQFTWEEMKANSYIVVDEKNRLNSVVKSLYGTLVVEEGVTMRTNKIFQAAALNAVYLPPSVTKINDTMFADNPSLTEVRCFGKITTIDSYAFSGCTGLKTVILQDGLEGIGNYAFNGCTALESLAVPESVTYIGTSAFKDCAALTDINMPASLKHIDDQAFINCSALTSMILPEGFETLDENVLSGTGITEFTGPASMKWFGRQARTNLVRVDLANTAITYFDGSTFNSCLQLESVKLPLGLTKMYDTEFKDCPALKSIELPDSLTTFDDGWSADMSSNTSVTSLVWPVTLTNGTHLATLPNLETILYRGSELQWNLTVSKDLFAGKNIVFNYVPEA